MSKSAALVACIVVAAGACGSARADAPGPVTLAPHTAVYDMTLSRSSGQTGITSVDGRLVFSLSGSECAGYITGVRFVAQIGTEDSTILSDTRSTTWESGDGGTYRFASQRYTNGTLAEETRGEAHRDGGVVVDLDIPVDETFRLPGDVIFPSHHMLMILDVARSGDWIFEAPVFDGAETGRKVYDTASFVGREQPAWSAAKAKTVAGNAAEELSTWTSRHVSIGYFERGSDSPELPSYEFSYDLFANGISRSIGLDYGDFALQGELVELDLAEDDVCDL